MQPPLAVQRFRAGLGIVPIALHDARSPCKQLAAAAIRTSTLSSGMPTDSGTLLSGRFTRDHRRGLGHSVSPGEPAARAPRTATQIAGSSGAPPSNRDLILPPSLASTGPAMRSRASARTIPSQQARFAARGAPSRRYPPDRKAASSPRIWRAASLRRAANFSNTRAPQTSPWGARSRGRPRAARPNDVATFAPIESGR